MAETIDEKELKSYVVNELAHGTTPEILKDALHEMGIDPDFVDQILDRKLKPEMKMLSEEDMEKHEAVKKAEEEAVKKKAAAAKVEKERLQKIYKEERKGLFSGVFGKKKEKNEKGGKGKKRAGKKGKEIKGVKKESKNDFWKYDANGENGEEKESYGVDFSKSNKLIVGGKVVGEIPKRPKVEPVKEKKEEEEEPFIPPGQEEKGFFAKFFRKKEPKEAKLPPANEGAGGKGAKSNKADSVKGATSAKKGIAPKGINQPEPVNAADLIKQDGAEPVVPSKKLPMVKRVGEVDEGLRKQEEKKLIAGARAEKPGKATVAQKKQEKNAFQKGAEAEHKPDMPSWTDEKIGWPERVPKPPQKEEVPKKKRGLFGFLKEKKAKGNQSTK